MEENGLNNLKRNKMTAVEWLEEKAKEFAIDLDLLHCFEQAKVMEKKDICYFGAKCCIKTTEKKSWTIEELYDETFSK